MTAQPSAFGARPPAGDAGHRMQQQPGLLHQLQQREQQQAQTQEPSRAPAGGHPPVNPLGAQPSSPSPWPQRPSGPRAPRRILGIQPVLFVGICLLAIVTIVTVVLIFIGDFESQAARVVWTVVVFLAFTALLALDLVLARRSSTPLVIGVAANIYLLAVLMISIWMRGTGGDDRDPWSDEWLFGELFGIVLLTILVVRAAAAGAWGLIVLGDRGRALMARVIGRVAAGLLGLVGILLTLHFALDAFGAEVDEWYWRATVAAIVVTALAASVTVLLFWNRRNIDWQEAEARGEHVLREPRPRAGGAPNPAADPAAMHAGVARPPQQPPAPAAPATAPGAGGLLPWPTYADGTPLPMGPDGQPVFPPR
ncbi:hypothetical protein [Agrococcus sp. HG114]|uniref:hypothetical protein n=1 Tax=Agrococcus sp. HG114 TaxID=2969757 RepID=UPI00215A8237|nr:hypothetical protein [Agrococcus sp. HG114]MCR8670883.1 hypothetical protein [Agrococcus sp. HG114]